MPSLKDFHVRIPCHPNTRRSPDDYVRAFQWIDQFLQSYTGRRLHSAAFIFAPCKYLEDRSLLLASLIQRNPFSFPGTLRFFDFQPKLELHLAAETLDLTPLLLLPSQSNLRSLLLAACDFVLINPLSWDSQPNLTRLRVQGEPRHPISPINVSCSQLSLALSYAAPSWRHTVTNLQLYSVPFDHDCAFAIGELAVLTHFDLAPVTLDVKAARLLMDDDNDALLEANSRLEHSEQNRLAGLPGAVRLVLAPAADRLAHQAMPAYLIYEYCRDDLFLLLKLCLPLLSRLRVMHIGVLCRVPNERLVEAGSLSAHIAAICPSLQLVAFGPRRYPHSSAMPVELWDMIMAAPDNDDDRGRVALGLSALCCHSRCLAINRAYVTLRITDDNIFLLDSHVRRMRLPGVPTPFDFTRAVRAVPRLHDLSPLLRILPRTFPELTSLTIAFRPVDYPLPEDSWDFFRDDLNLLRALSGAYALRHFSFYLVVSHPHEGQTVDVRDLCHLNSLALHSLSLRMTGGIDFVSRANLMPPTTLRLLRLSVELFALVDSSFWAVLPLSFVRLDIEESRMSTHMRRFRADDAARTLASAIWDAAPGLREKLRTLRLTQVYISYAAILAIPNLTGLTRLDLHPEGRHPPVDEEVILDADNTLTVIQPVSEDALKRSGVRPRTGSLLASPSWYQLSVWVPVLRYLLSHLPQLTVLHFGGFGRTLDTNRVAPVLDMQARHLALFTKLHSSLHPALSLWHFGRCDLPAHVRSYLHIPTCGKCAPLGPGRRSPECLLYEDYLSGEHPDDAFFAQPYEHDLRVEFKQRAPVSPA
ncbi:hypothetical protein AURDEDRAFT_131927 [Auricularia subglabra TFB-10046 SS5]|uniref:Uncharacterized protein n=1 Tax=Auricularia subglabra (strain TFB-10046 / SS5) TaxID=717982 RepID=J0WMC3_AURST|nr:hypothetical protein AURDEDRAFT_131927 [Auricularia subglabra TFB-10046 SS5]